MPTEVILPALGMAQETGKIVRWLKAEGEQVNKSEPIAEVETDKATVELEASATGILHIKAAQGDDVPVGQVIALIQSTHESTQMPAQNSVPPAVPVAPKISAVTASNSNGASVVKATSLATRVAAEHNVDLSLVTPLSKDQRIKMSDVVAYVQEQQQMPATTPLVHKAEPRLLMASPKARRLASEQGKDLSKIHGSGPDGAILAADVVGATFMTPTAPTDSHRATELHPNTGDMGVTNEGIINVAPTTVWRIMAERTTQSWTSTPHFMLTREVNATRLIAWREQLLKRNKGDKAEKVTYTDLLVKVVALVLRDHPRLNASWNEGKITLHSQINIGIAVASDDGLIVPVIHAADTLSIGAIAQRRKDVGTRTHAGKIRPEDLANGTFTISNLGMYGVDAFNAIINAPQSAILAVGRIAERVVPIDGQPKVQPMMALTLSCDHRVIDGVRGAQFLSALVEIIEEPLGLLS